MSVDLRGRSFLTLKDFTGEEIEYLVDLAKDLKEKKKKRIFEKNLLNINKYLLSKITLCNMAQITSTRRIIPI